MTMSISRAPGLHAFLDLLHAQVVGRETRGKSGGDGGDGNAGACQRLDGGGHHLVIDADRARGDRRQAERVEDVGAHGLARLRAEPSHAALGVVTRERGQVDQRDGTGEPCGLVGLFHRAPPGQGGRAAFDGRCVGLHPRDPVEVERQPRVARLVKLRQLAGVSGNGAPGRGGLRLGHGVALFGGILTRKVSCGGSLWQA
jgi:hypothetical protein